MRLGLGLLGELNARESAKAAALADEAGFESIWLAETRFERDAISTATAAAMYTTDVRIATSVINPFTRGAALIAVTMASLDDVTGGRAILGIGPGSPLVLAAQGIEFKRPLARLRDYVTAIRAVWAGESYEGEYATIRNVILDFEPPRRAIPIYLGVTGPKALMLAGEIADGVILNSPTTVTYVERACRIVRDAAERAGRDPSEIEIMGDVIIGLDTEARSGRDLVGPIVATYLTRFPNLANESGISPEELREYQQISNNYGVDVLSRELPAAIIDGLTANGDIRRCRQQLDAYKQAGLDGIVLTARPAQLEAVIRAFAPRS